jgi:hypothetical protein
MHEPSETEPGYETRDFHVRPIAIFGVGLALLTGVVLLLMAWMFGYFEIREERVDVPESPLLSGAAQPPPEPRLQISSGADLDRVRSEEDAALNSYGWEDRAAGKARIPIDRAIELLAQKGLPVRK